MEQLSASNLPSYPEDDSIIIEYVALRRKPFDYVCKTRVVSEEPKDIKGAWLLTFFFLFHLLIYIH